MLHCNEQHAAMQTNALHLVSGIHKKSSKEIDWQSPLLNQRMRMSRSATVSIRPPATVFSRLVATLDRVLMTNATIAARNGDIPYFGL
jgi:hypothetical protein